MGRAPCCDKNGVKKGPWTPEEDIMLVSYVQEHGPGNWKSVPTNTGLRRCSKSCRLRWANYLRPGIKRGSFSDHEEKMIVQLQALVGNKWAAIASYLPERTDNDIKNYWNTHLKKKLMLKKGQQSGSGHFSEIGSHRTVPRGKWEKRLQTTDIKKAEQALKDAVSSDIIDHQSSTFFELSSSSSLTQNCSSSFQESSKPFKYASSTENIARLLKNWVVRTDPQKDDESSKCSNSESNNKDNGDDLTEAFESLFGYNSFDSSNSSSYLNVKTEMGSSSDSSSGFPRLSMLESWLLDDHGKNDYYMAEFSFDENPISF